MAIPPHRHTEFKIWKDYELFLDWHFKEEFLVWVSPSVLCNLGNQPMLRIQECLLFSLSPIEKELCWAFYRNFCCAIFIWFFFQEDKAFLWFSSVSCRNIHLRKKIKTGEHLFSFQGILKALWEGTLQCICCFSINTFLNWSENHPQ